MGAVAKRLPARSLAAAKEDRLGFFGLVEFRRDSRPLMGAVAEGLGFAASAGAPIIFFSFFDIDLEGSFLSD